MPVIRCAEWLQGFRWATRGGALLSAAPQGPPLCYPGSHVPLWCSPEARMARLHYSATWSATLECNYSISSSSVSTPQESYIITINISIQIPQGCGLWSFGLSIFWTDFCSLSLFDWQALECICFPICFTGWQLYFEAQRIKHTDDWQQNQNLLSCGKIYHYIPLKK